MLPLVCKRDLPDFKKVRCMIVFRLGVGGGERQRVLICSIWQNVVMGSKVVQDSKILLIIIVLW